MAAASLQDVLETMLQAVQGGELHVRPMLARDDARCRRFVEIGLALRECFVRPELRSYFIERLKPHLRYVIGTLPAGIQRHGMLPPEAAPSLTLEQVGDDELRQWLIDDGSMIYGELTRQELDNYFGAIAPHIAPGARMVDLGSGLGKVVMSAALSLPFGHCTGVELLDYRYAMALERLERMLAAGAQAVAQLPQPPQPDEELALPGAGGVAPARHLLDARARISFVRQDMFQADVGDADLVFIYSTCFAPLMDALGAKLARELREGCLVSTTTFPLAHPAFRLVRHFPAPTLAWTGVFLYRREGALDTLPAAASARLYQPSPDEWEIRVIEEFALYDAGGRGA